MDNNQETLFRSVRNSKLLRMLNAKPHNEKITVINTNRPQEPLERTFWVITKNTGHQYSGEPQAISA